MTEQEIARQPLEEIPLQQWIHLVHYWFSNKGKVTIYVFDIIKLGSLKIMLKLFIYSFRLVRK